MKRDLGRVLVTGGSGFLGTALRARLEHRAEAIFAPDSRTLDLRSAAAIEERLAAIQPDVVIHLAAAVGGIGANQNNAGRFFYENALMGLQLLEGVRKFTKAKFVGVGTACSYPADAPMPLVEDDLWSGFPDRANAPYGLAKLMLLAQLQAYRREYGTVGIYLIPTNLYGPGDHFDLVNSHVVPAMIRKFDDAMIQRAPAVSLWGSGNATRDFLYVDDCAKAIVAAAVDYEDESPVNLGSGREIAIRSLAQVIAGLIGYRGKVEWDTSKPEGYPRRCMSIVRARQLLGFEAATDLQEGLARTIDWWQANRAQSVGQKAEPAGIS